MAGDSLRVAIIDFQLGNLLSVRRACELVGLDAIVTSDPAVIMAADGAILPGVGAFGDAMDSLKRLDLVGPIKAFLETGRPFMGICLGLQLLMSESEEFGMHRGLDLVPGGVVKFDRSIAGQERVRKVPQVGWNRIYRPRRDNELGWESSPLRGVAERRHMYFVHSYYVVPVDPSVVLSYTDYEGIEYCSSISVGNLFACQFHPEKSGEDGIRIYRNFADSIQQRT